MPIRRITGEWVCFPETVQIVLLFLQPLCRHGIFGASVRRLARVVEEARLESVYTGNRIEGSNPSVSAPARRSFSVGGLCLNKLRPDVPRNYLKLQKERRSLTFGGLYLHVSLVQHHNLFAKTQTDSAPTLFCTEKGNEYFV